MKKSVILIFLMICTLFIFFQQHVFAWTNTIIDDATGIITYDQRIGVSDGSDEQKLKIPIPSKQKCFLDVTIDGFCSAPWMGYYGSRLYHGNQLLKEGRIATWQGDVYDSNYYIEQYVGSGAGVSIAVTIVKIHPYFKLTISTNADYGIIYNNNEPFYMGETYEYKAGTSLSLRAVPDSGYAFIGWEGASSCASPTANLMMNKDKTIKAVFADIHVDDVTGLPSEEAITNMDGKVRLAWNDVDDVSGIKQYRIKITTTEEEPVNEDGYLSTDVPSINLEDLSSKNTYYAWVKAEDKTGNISENWLKIGPFSPPGEKSAITKCSPTSYAEGDTLTYQTELTLTEVDAAKYIIERRLAGDDIGPWVQIAAISQDELNKDPFDPTKFIYIDNRELIKHAQYKYRVYTQNALEEGDTTNSQTYGEIVTVANIVSYKNEGLTNPGNGRVTNQTTHNFNITPKTDVEGDEIRFRVICKNGEKTISSSDATAQNEVDVTFPSDGLWEWTMEIEEYADGILVSDSKNKVTGTILIDQTAPHGSISFQSTGGTELTNYTNSLDLKLANLQATDNAGLKNSGVAGIYLWNGIEQPTEYRKIAGELPETLDETDLSAIAAGEKGIYIDISSGSDTPVFEIVIERALPWRIIGGSDGERIISLAVKDNAGNIQETVQNKITLDTTPPAAVTFEACTFDGENLVFNWRITDTGHDLKTFCVTKPDGEEEVTKVRDETNDEQYKGSLGVEMTPFGYNAPIMIEVLAMDQAGNRSESAALTAYTKAQVGRIVPESLTPGHSKETGHQFTLTVTGGIAARQLLEVATTQDFQTIEKSVEIGAGDKFTVTGLDAHGTYYYRPVAENGDGVRTEGPVLEYVVPNLPPPKPEDLYPNQYASKEVVFTFDQKTVDDEGDNLTYTYCWNGGGGSFTPVPWDAEKQCYSVTLSETEHNKTYSWYVTVDDGHGGTNISEIVNFTIDINAPVLTLKRPVTVYTNQEQLSFTVSDDLSGVPKIEYQLTDALTNTLIGRLESIDPAAGVVPLPEGYYHLDVTATDQAGNHSTESIKNLWVDRTSPELSDLVLSLPHNGTEYYTNAALIPLTWKAIDDFSGIRGIYYWILTAQTQPPADGKFISLSPGGGEYALSINLDRTVGRYYLAVAACDQAGNVSEIIKINQPILLDATAPEVTFKLSGLHRQGTKNYLSPVNMNNLKVKASEAVDSESGIKEKRFILLNESTGQPIAESAEFSGLTGAALTAGGRYKIIYQVTNGVGLQAEKASPVFTYDDTAPEGLTLNLPQTALAQGEIGRFPAAATESETEIVTYRLGIGTSDNKLGLTSQVPGNDKGWIVVNTPSSCAEFRVEIPEITDGAYDVTLSVENAAGLTEELKAGTITVDNSQERVIVGDQGPYTMFGERISGFWRYAGAKEVKAYRYRLIDDAGMTVAGCDWQETTETSATITQLNLATGERYRFEVKAIFIDNTESASSCSPGVTVDTTVPEIVELITPLFTTSRNLTFKWEGSDTDSGIKRIQVALGTDYYKTDVSQGWVEISGKEATLLYDATGDELEFDLENNDRYYLTLRLTNGAGLATELASACIIIDDTPPPTPVVADLGSYINTKNEQPLEANWIWTPVDRESGNTEYKYAILKFGEKITPDTVWHEGDESKRLSLTMEDFARVHGVTYYFAVKTTNGAGLTSIGYSDGIMVDENAPFLTKVILLEAANLGDAEAPEVNYITDNKDLGLWIDSYDPHSDIDTYLYTWGNKEEVDDKGRILSPEELIRLEDPQIEEGAVTVFLGETKNGAQLVSDTGYTTGVVLDTKAPQISDVHGALSGNRLLFDWAVEESVSPVVRYEYALLTEEEYAAMTEDESYIPPWEAAPDLTRSLALNADNICDGKYYLIVRGYNAAGTYSRRSGEINEWGISPLLTIDRTPPVISAAEFKVPEFVDKDLKSRVGAEDTLSGLHSYQYALGGITDLFMYSGGWVDVMQNDGVIDLPLIDTEQIPHHTELYLMVRAKDRVGLWSPAKLSTKITVDHTKPVTPELTCSKYTTVLSEVTKVGFVSTDPESGLTHYRLGVVTSPDQTEVTDWLFAKEGEIGDFTATFHDLELEEGSRYYLAIRTRNGVGLWSETGFSDSFLVDTTAPEIIFSKAAETIVINHPPLNIEYTLTEAAEVRFVLSGADGSFETYIASGTGGLNTFVFNESTPQTYTLAATAIDPAGNTGAEKTQSVRVNAPPRITLPPVIFTTPGAPIIFTAVIYDPDAIEGDVYEYVWDPGDGSGFITGEEPEYHYGNEIKDYTITLTVTDKDGGIATSATTVKVRNTMRGRLYMDEIWFGEHYLYGEVLVPEGITLTIRPGTKVKSDQSFFGEEVTLVVKGALKVEGSTEGVTFSSVGTKPGDWAGIYLEGRAIIEGMTMQHAIRGLTVVEDAEAIVTDSIFRDNLLGIHCYAARPVIEETFFIGHAWYGIKEDAGARPTVINCIFTGNEIDYYSIEKSILTIDELNAIEGNGGNQENQ